MSAEERLGLLEGQSIIVTGGARGIGAAIARAYLEQGAKVAILDIRDELGGRVAAEFGTDSRCLFLHCDVSVASQVETAFATVADQFGGLDVLAAVAGLDRPAPPEDLTEADWDLVMGVNAKGTFLTNQAAFRLLKARGGSIINFSSVAGIRGMPDRPAYSAAKGAVAAWTRSVAQAWGVFGVRVNTIAPIMHTDVAERYLQSLAPEARAAAEDRLAGAIPLGGRMGDVKRDLAPLMVFLAGPGGAYITGQLLAVDGGMTMVGA